MIPIPLPIADKIVEVIFVNNIKQAEIIVEHKLLSGTRGRQEKNKQDILMKFS